MSQRSHSESVDVACLPEALYEMVADVTRMGEWSPACKAAWWDEGDGPRLGAHFTGRNVDGDSTWETRCEVVVAEPGREFAWIVGDAFVRWGYVFEPVDTGTRLTESWEFLPGGVAMFRERLGDQAEAQIAYRTRAALSGITATLAAIKAAGDTAVAS
jgi:hypothetical protein